MEIKAETTMGIEEQCGDFLERCLPVTYKYFKKLRVKTSNECESIDAFDLFIKNEVRVFSFLIDEYYKHKQVARMKLSSFASDGQLLHFDELIHIYLKEKSMENYHKIKELYIFMLESKIVDMMNKQYGS